mmetsp:Transcript_474/g.1559  ORF Transcript_474/g.1559 Transcript_474/m.1559 type:complete len:252 (-) Transcript_474:308-1063(-)
MAVRGDAGAAMGTPLLGRAPLVQNEAGPGGWRHAEGAPSGRRSRAQARRLRRKRCIFLCGVRAAMRAPPGLEDLAALPALGGAPCEVNESFCPWGADGLGMASCEVNEPFGQSDVLGKAPCKVNVPFGGGGRRPAPGPLAAGTAPAHGQQVGCFRGEMPIGELVGCVNKGEASGQGRRGARQPACARRHALRQREHGLQGGGRPVHEWRVEAQRFSGARGGELGGDAADRHSRRLPFQAWSMARRSHAGGT